MDHFKNIEEIPFRCDLKRGHGVDGYLIETSLGEGTFGIVYRVKKDNRHYALKLLKLWEIHHSERERLVKRFSREFRCGQIQSPYLVQSLDCGKYNGNPYFVMELCPKGNLTKYIKDPPPIARTNQVAYEILLGLKDLHENGVFHRDIKPDNILFDHEDQVKLTDFGIAGFKNQRMTVKNFLGHTRQVFGTYAYIAPEQFNPKKAFKSMDAVTDIFSFGVTMYKYFTDKYPFGPLSNDTELSIYMNRARKGQWEDIDHLDIPEYWKTILKGCLEPDYRNKRFQSVDTIIRALGYRVGRASMVEDEKNWGLLVTHGEENGRIYDLAQLLGAPQGVVTIGWYNKKSPQKNQLEIVESVSSYISTYHATIERHHHPDRWVIRDGQQRNKNGAPAWYPSTNGVVVNSKKIDTKGIEIRLNDIIIIGDTVLKVVLLNK